jgi:3-hydroxy-9,10-secoandrosta-1,3,5(10)-triene-9,17-dione monooxygenase
MHEAVEKARKAADLLREESVPSDELGRLTDRTVEAMHETGLVRLLQPREYAGHEAHPNDFLEAVMAVGVAAPSAGWVAGVVGVHPWEIAMMDPRLQEEIWGEDPDTWTASPYAPFGRATRVDGGFLFTGQWPYSTGTDHAQWVILGGMVVDADGQVGTPPDMRHFVIPRGDYEIVEDSWNVMGLEGTGSKDVRMTDVFIPDYRVVEAATMIAGGYEHRQEGKALYRMKFPVVFSAAIAAGTQGIAQGALSVYRDYLAQRVSADGIVGRTDPNQLIVYGEAAADIAASRSHLLTSVAEMFDHVSAGGELTRSQRLTFRRDQVRASRRCADAVDRLYKISGASGIRKDFPNERYWRDLQVALSHICNVAENIYAGWSTDDLGGEASPALYV